jgi:hypothetical protein
MDPCNFPIWTGLEVCLSSSGLRFLAQCRTSLLACPPADPAFESYFLFSIPTLDLEAASSHPSHASNPHAYPNFYTHGFQTRASAASSIVAKPLLEPCRMTISGCRSFGVTTLATSLRLPLFFESSAYGPELAYH